MHLKYYSVLLAIALNLTYAIEDPLTKFEVKTLKKPKICLRIAEVGDYLKVHYIGRLTDENGEIFESSRDNGETFDFVLGAGQVIQGYEEGVPGMCLGETRTLQVPPHMAYGENGYPPVIPPQSSLHFTVEIMQLDKKRSDL